jgi:serine/threonine protein kinase
MTASDQVSVAPQENMPSIPGYELLCELGRGGMGVVYKARQPSCNRLVALKLILSGRGAHILELARFRIEAEAVACLAHPNVVLIHDVGVADGYPFFALEYAAGGNLTQRIQNRPQPPRWAAEVVKSLSLALHHAHERGILHRDLKPANVLLMEDGTPKVTDFGLAKFSRPLQDVSRDCCTRPCSSLEIELYRLMREYAGRSEQAGIGPDFQEFKKLGGPGSPDGRSFEQFATQSLCHKHLSRFGPDVESRGELAVEEFLAEAERQNRRPLPRGLPFLNDLTDDGAIMGSPQYMAPEQALGESSAIGPPTDVYALGAVLYAALTGHPPFRGATQSHVLEQVISQPPPAIEPRVGWDLEAICLKCLEKRREQRYQSAADLGDDLQRFLDGYAVNAAQSGLAPTAPPAALQEAPRHVSTTGWDRAPDREADPHRTRRWWQIWK